VCQLPSTGPAAPPSPFRSTPRGPASTPWTTGACQAVPRARVPNVPF
ncbi:uncharacterized protein METZ01_LOCUS141887, partial [marine metagenome]